MKRLWRDNGGSCNRFRGWLFKRLVHEFQGIAEDDGCWVPIIVAEKSIEDIDEGVAVMSGFW